MQPDKIRFLFGELPAGVDPDDPKARAQLLARDPRAGAADLAARGAIATQIANDNPPELWATAQRLQALLESPAAVLEQLAFTLAHVLQSATAEDREFDAGEFVALLERLPLPDPPTLGERLVEAVRQAPGSTIDTLSRQVLVGLDRDADDPLALSIFDRVHAQLTDDGGPLALLAGNRIVHVADLVAGSVFTHRLSEEEATYGIIDAFDLVGLDRLPSLRLPGGDALEVAETLKGELGWAGPEGWLTRFETGSVIAVRAQADGAVTFEAVPEPSSGEPLVQSLWEAYDRAAEESQLPVRLEELVLSLALEDRATFAEPRPPLGELCVAAGLELRGQEVAHDAHLWGHERQLEALSRVFGYFSTDTERTAALRALDAAADPGVAPAVLREVLAGLRDEAVIAFVADELLSYSANGSLKELGAFVQRLLRAARRPGEIAPAAWLAAVVAEADCRILDAEQFVRQAADAEGTWAPGLDRAGWYAFDRGNAAEAAAFWAALEDPPEDLDTLRQIAAEVPQRHLGRNEACWCGSGRKFKHCHLGRAELLPLADRASWLYRKAIGYLERQGTEADSALLAHAKALSVSRSDEAVVDALGDAMVADATLTEGGWLEEFLRQRGALLPEDEAELAGMWTQVARTVYKVIERTPDGGLVLVDLRTGERLDVWRCEPSRQAKPGALICGRALPDSRAHQFMGATFLVAPGTEDEVLDLCGLEDGVLLCSYAGQLRWPERSGEGAASGAGAELPAPEGTRAGSAVGPGSDAGQGVHYHPELPALELRVGDR